jgi:hypothetical protein
MRKITTGVGLVALGLIGFGIVGLATASAEPFRFNDHHGVAEFGSGGWMQNSHDRPFASGAIAVAKTDVTVTRPERPDFDRRFLLFAPDADCLFTPAMPTAGRRSRAGCK